MHKVLHPSFSVRHWSETRYCTFQSILAPDKFWPCKAKLFLCVFHSLWTFPVLEYYVSFGFWFHGFPVFGGLSFDRLMVPYCKSGNAIYGNHAGFLLELGAFGSSTVHTSKIKKGKSFFPLPSCTICEE